MDLLCNTKLIKYSKNMQPFTSFASSLSLGPEKKYMERPQSTSKRSPHGHSTIQSVYDSSMYNEVHDIEHTAVHDAWNRSKDPLRTNSINPSRDITYMNYPTNTRRTSNDNPKNTTITLLSGETLSNAEGFKHNNMVPFFGSQVRQNTSDSSFQPRMELFTGVSGLSIEKGEQKPFFAPEDNKSSTIQGLPVTINETIDRYIPSRFKQGELIQEPIHVGPGLNKGYTHEPSGGFQQADTRDYVMPKSVDDLRVETNPKVTYKGVIIPGKGIAKREQISTLSKHRPERFYENNIARYRATPIISRETTRSEIIKKCTSRQDQHIAYEGHKGPGAFPKENARSEEYTEPKNQCLNSFPQSHISAPHTWDAEKDQKKDSFCIDNTKREEQEVNSYWSNVTSFLKQVVLPVQDLLRPSKKIIQEEENFVLLNLQSSYKKPQMHDDSSVMRTTIRETLTPNPLTSGTVYYPTKQTLSENHTLYLRTTIKETNLESEETTGHISGPKRLTVYDPSDVTRTTIKEINIHDTKTGVVGNQIAKSTVYDPSEVTRTTIKEINIHDTKTGAVGNQIAKSTVYDPSDVTRTTVKEINIHDTKTGAVGNQIAKSTVYDPSDVTRTTVKEINIHDTKTGVMGNQIAKSTVYDPSDVTRTTVKEINIHDTKTGTVGNQIAKSTVYDPSDVTRTTIKEINIHDTKTGAVGNQIAKSTVYDPSDVTRTTVKEIGIYTPPHGIVSKKVTKQKLPIVDVIKTTTKETLVGPSENMNLVGQEHLSYVYDPELSKPKTTIKELDIDHKYVGQVNQQAIQSGYLTNDVQVPTTHREFDCDHEYKGDAYGAFDSVGAYQTTVYEAKNVHRQELCEYEYEGPATNYIKHPTNYDDQYNASLNENRQLIAKGRMPTLSSVKSCNGADRIPSVDPRKFEQTNHREYCFTKVVNLYQGQEISTREKQPYNDEHYLQERTDPYVLQSIQDNPLSISILK